MHVQVFAFPDEKFSEMGFACGVAKPDVEPAESKILDICRERTAPFNYSAPLLRRCVPDEHYRQTAQVRYVGQNDIDVGMIPRGSDGKDSFGGHLG